MRKTPIILTAIFALNVIVLVFADEGFKIELKNTRLETINYNILQIDHGFPKWPGPVTVMGGQLESGKNYVSIYERNFGKYLVQWYSSDGKYKYEFVFTVRPPTKKIVIYCDKVVYQ
jgi:hypothetical protein